MRHVWAVLTVVLAIVSGLVGVGVATGAPQAAACDRWTPECQPDKPGPTALFLSGTILFETNVFTFQAKSQDGEASGQVTVPTSADLGGPVLDVTERGDNEYCVLVEASSNPPFRIAYYIRDVGDGLTTFDQYTSFGSFSAITCETFEPQPSDFLTVTAGNVTVTRGPVS